MIDKIIELQVKETYLKNIEKAVDALNKFSSSNFKQKNFPMVDGEDENTLEPSIYSILKWLSHVNASWVDDTSKVSSIVEDIHNLAEKFGKSDNLLEVLSDENDDQNIDKINQYIGFQMLQYIANHQKEFQSLLDGIHSFKLFVHPSHYKDALDVMTAPIPMDDIDDVIGDNTYSIFDEKTYIDGIFHSSDIKILSNLKQERELERFHKREDYRGISLVHDESNEESTVQEQAEINFFSMVNPNHIRYHQNRFQPSQQFVTVIKQLIAGLKKCNTPDDVKKFLNDKQNHVNPDDYTSMVLPSILARVFDNEQHFQNRLFREKNLKKYMDSYQSIMKQNDGAKRFKDYDLFSTFKADKEGTIQFLEDFLSLRLVSDQNATITNHTLLVLFNIFDSRIYLDILYNVLPQSEKKGEYETEDGFVKAVRARINENSNKANPYDNHTKKEIDITDPTVKTSSEVTEYASMMVTSLGNIDIDDMRYCGKIVQEALHMEISAMADKAYNVGLDESDILDFIYQERYIINGKVPNYMQDRINMVDSQGKPETSIEEVPLPEGVPANDINDLINSIEDRVDEITPNEDGEMDLSDGFGKDANVSPKDKDSHIVYNITYNYNNSNNTTTTTDSHNTTTNTDHSINKTTGGTSNNTYRPKQSDHTKTQSTQESNNNNNASSSNSKDSQSENKTNDSTFSTGKSVQEVFAMLQSKEPLFQEGAEKIAGSMVGSFGADMGLMPDYNPPPKVPLQVKAQDFDRKMLSKQEEAKKKVTNAQNTVKAVKQPFERTKAWVTDKVDEIISMDEDKAKYRMLEDKNYRTTVCKVFRLACDLELFTLAATLSPYLGLLVAGKKALDYGEKTRMKKDIQKDFVTELEIIDDKIRKANADGRQEEKYQLMRIRRKMVDKASSITKDPIAKVKPLNPMNRHGYDYW